MSSQCPVSPPVSQWILTVRPTLPSCLGMLVTVLWSITAVPILWMETHSTVTALSPPAQSKAWNVVTFTIFLSKPLTAYATAHLVHLCRMEQVNISALKFNYHSSQLTALLVNSPTIHFCIHKQNILKRKWINVMAGSGSAPLPMHLKTLLKWWQNFL